MASGIKKMNNADPRAALYEKLIRTNPRVERKGATMPYTSLNGNMFTMLGKSGLALRLPEGEREKFLKKYKTHLYTAYGATLKEYVAVPESLLKKTKELKRYFYISYAYARTLKPKRTSGR